MKTIRFYTDTGRYMGWLKAAHIHWMDAIHWMRSDGSVASSHAVLTEIPVLSRRISARASDTDQ